MSTKQLVVIGAGPGGYPAAFYAADSGMDVTIIDQEANPGGVCLYRGCIPSKSILHIAKIMTEAREASRLGVTFAEPGVNIEKMREWKERVVKKLTDGLGQLTTQRKINYIRGRAKLIDSHTVLVTKPDGAEERLAFQHAILASGSRPATIPGLPNSPRIWDSTGALSLETIPGTLLIIGGG